MQKSCESLTDHIKFLTPDENASQCEIYTKLLEHAIKEKSAKNIALAGPYGSGKSSILKYLTKKLAQKKKIVEISLANFEDLGEDLKKKKAKEKEAGSALYAGAEKVKLQFLFEYFISSPDSAAISTSVSLR